jgi:putative DNA primase/helicase
MNTDQSGDMDDARPPAFSDDSLAWRYADRHAGDLRFVAKWGQWFRYGGTRWRQDDTLQAFDLARRICREASAE